MSATTRRLARLRAEARAIADGATARDRARIVRVLLEAHVRLGRARHVLGRLPKGADPPRRIALRSGADLLVRRADAIPFWEQIGLDVYSVVDLTQAPVRTVVDLGANVGFATIALQARYPEAHFVCVEPVEGSRRQLTENLRRNGVDAQVFDVAVTSAPGRYSVLRSHHLPAADTVAVCPDGDIEGVTLATLLDRAAVDEVDLMKIDIEGGERGVFADAAAWAPRVRALIGELHDGLTPAGAAAMLGPHGYRAVELPSGERARGLVAFVRDGAA